MKTEHLNDFSAAIVENVKAKISELRSEGIVGMTPENLLQVTRTPGRHLRGAPTGVNAPFYYRNTFLHLIDGLRVDPDYSDFFIS